MPVVGPALTPSPGPTQAGGSGWMCCLRQRPACLPSREPLPGSVLLEGFCFRGCRGVSLPDHAGPRPGPVPAAAPQAAQPPAPSPREGEGHREVCGHDPGGERRLRTEGRNCHVTGHRAERSRSKDVAAGVGSSLERTPSNPAPWTSRRQGQRCLPGKGLAWRVAGRLQRAARRAGGQGTAGLGGSWQRGEPGTVGSSCSGLTRSGNAAHPLGGQGCWRPLASRGCLLPDTAAGREPGPASDVGLSSRHWPGT